MKNPKLYSKVWNVPSSSGGDAHEVLMVKKSGNLSCDCMGWRFRRTCRHVQAVLANKAGKGSPIKADPKTPAAPKVLRKQVVTIVQKFSNPNKRSK